MSEAYKSKCLACNSVYRWSGFKTGIGKSREQLLEMAKESHTCRRCGSKELVTGLDWTGSMYSENMKALDPEFIDYSILTEYEMQRRRKEFSGVSTSMYHCRHCNSTHHAMLNRWEDTDGKFLLLYCNDCKKRFAVPMIDEAMDAPSETPKDNTDHTITVPPFKDGRNIESIADGMSSHAVLRDEQTGDPTRSIPFVSTDPVEVKKFDEVCDFFKHTPLSSNRISMTEKHSAPKITLHQTGPLPEDDDDDDPVFTAVAPIINPHLIHVDPYDTDLDESTMHAIIKECTCNFWYFAQNILKINSSDYNTRMIDAIVAQMYKSREEMRCETSCSRLNHNDINEIISSGQGYVEKGSDGTTSLVLNTRINRLVIELDVSQPKEDV